MMYTCASGLVLKYNSFYRQSMGYVKPPACVWLLIARPQASQ
jgi:hypothetical protein